MKLIKLGLNHWLCASDSVYIDGPFEHVSRTMQENHGIDPDEIASALDEMQKNGHDFAEFGVAGCWVFTAIAARNTAA